jgi:hypothetical protein
MHTWETARGFWYIDGKFAGAGHSGRGPGWNRPFNPDARMPDRADMTQQAHVGPMPEGYYRISPAFHHPRLGPLTMSLLPEPGTEMYKRSRFFLHGPGGDPADDSEGCPVLGHFEREGVAKAVAGGDARLHVVANYTPEVA